MRQVRQVQQGRALGREQGRRKVQVRAWPIAVIIQFQFMTLLATYSACILHIRTLVTMTTKKSFSLMLC